MFFMTVRAHKMTIIGAFLHFLLIKTDGFNFKPEELLYYVAVSEISAQMTNCGPCESSGSVNK